MSSSLFEGESPSRLMPSPFPQLPYADNALAPMISAYTLGFRDSKHHEI
jgi:superoxide dismutase